MCVPKRSYFTEDLNEDIRGKPKFSSLGGVLETFYYSTMLQEVGFFPTWVLLLPFWLI